VHALGLRKKRLLLRKMGMIHQQLHLVGSLRVVHNVNAGKLGGWPLFKAAWSLIHPLEIADAVHALESVGIAEKLHARTDTLSGGQQQRVAIARVLVQRPAAILADEPVSSVDPERGREVMDLLRDQCVRLNTTLVVSLHSLEFARSHVTRMVGLRCGQIVFDLPAEQVTNDVTSALYEIERP
jgi:phosphonate transport system ATP-binding protein